ncbi:RHS repeat-associated core domain-containing protein [Epilithonimonas vandammei]|uniref:Type IV secretion protein Rhs n=1 Tax=Epilithonimonas vandammei TaxID=2487072 RepID=A0A3G8YD94_9FLAO|nr:RHS repeat-associated core domain-containing protein [Epilithonimonas vandammei]AZI39201.1 type IV secretion protein Rhs [Epilithonimonas vandammei]
MKKLYLFFTAILSTGVYSQSILNQAETGSRTVSDPQTVILAQGFHASSNVSNPFIAKIGVFTENNLTNPTNSDAGSTNPSGTTAPTGMSFHDTQGNIDVNGGGQLQYTLPIALPPGVKSVAPQINLVYTSGSGNGIAGYGWNLSGITSISRVGRTIEKDGEVRGIKLDYSDYYSFNGQRLILKSGEYGKDGAEYVTEKYSNVKIKSVGVAQTATPQPMYFHVTFEDGSQAWYGDTQSDDPEFNSANARTSLDYYIVKWMDAQGNYISYNYEVTTGQMQGLVSRIATIAWGGNEKLNKPNFNEVKFDYIARDFVEDSYVGGFRFVQDKILKNITINANGSQFKKYLITHKKQGINYDFVDFITEQNSAESSANPVKFVYPENTQGDPDVLTLPDSEPFNGVKFTGDFNGDSYLDFVMTNGNIKLGAFNDNFSTISTNKSFNSKSLVVNTLIDTDGTINNGNGIIQLETNKLVGYVFKNNSFQKVFEKQVFENPCSNYSLPDRCTISTNIREGDLNGDGISDAFIEVSANVTLSYPCPGNNVAPSFEEPGNCIETHTIDVGNFIVDLKNQNNPVATYTNDAGVSDGLFQNQKYIDLDGDGKIDIINVTNTNYSVLEYVQTGTNQYLKKIRFTSNLFETKQNEFPVLYGDFNGDGKLDFTIPITEGKTGKDDWRFYMGTGIGFDSFVKTDFMMFKRPYQTWSSGCALVFKIHNYSIADLNHDGKSDIVHVMSENNLDIITGNRRKISYVIESRIVSGKENISLNFYSAPLKTFSFYNYDAYELAQFTPITNPIKSNNNYYDIFLYWKEKLHKIKSPTPLVELARIQSINQGNRITSVSYKELVPNDGYGFYYNSMKMTYPYISFDRINQSFAVSQLSQSNKIQQFKYRGYTANLHGKGILGFRQIARSSWFSNENTIVWFGEEIDPLNEGLLVKEWSVKTIGDVNSIFPTDISENNNQLLSYKKTDYSTDVLANGVKATLPWKSKTKDFLKDITTDSQIFYGSYYLPEETTTSINGGFATSETLMSYTHNPSGIGKDYYIGRPESKIESTTAYGDTKSTEENYDYSNNLLSNLSKKPSSSQGHINESYQYDGWGNIIEKTVKYQPPRGMTPPSLVQTEKAQYDDKGRFAIKKTDNLNLETNITYNDWGQVLTQTDPLGVILSNTYDGWGKLLTSKTNLTGQTTYTYAKNSDGGNVVTQYDPDGNISKKYTNKLGQEYKTQSKGFGQNNYVAKYRLYDAIGRQVKESEPYFDTATEELPSNVKWNEIEYDDTIFPTKVTAKAFNGKQMETTVSGRTTTVRELNGNLRTTAKTEDAVGNVITSTDKGGTINFGYNAAGQQISAKYGTNTVTTAYDDWGRKIEFNDPSNGIYTYHYDGLGRILTEISPKGTKEYTYNDFGQLATQQEYSNDGTSTNKSISYSYNSKGLLTSKQGTSNGKAYSNIVSYDTYGRVISTSENSNGKYFMKKGITYDDMMRIVSYEKSLYSSGQYTKVIIENVYDNWGGELYQVKDKAQNKVLWELQSTEADGKVLTAKLGGTSITNQYNSNNFLYTTQHKNLSNNATVLQMTYSFNAIKNELNTRTRGGDFNITENFEYDDNNRLVNWTDPVTGAFSQNAIKNTYDIKGRITNNDQVGEIKFTNSNKVYQATGMVLNTTGQQNFNEKLLQKITYNENNDPIFIDGLKGDVAFTYGLTEMRQMATYGGNFNKDGEGKFTKYYSEDGSYEIVRNNQTGQEKHILYIGGTPYESNILYLKDYTESSGSYKFLHKDYLGSILAITDEAGNAVEQRHYDAWGQFTHLKVGSQSMIVGVQQVTDFLANNSLLLDRGYTSHEHFSEVGLIHMNGRLYDSLLRRFLNADENIQDMFNTQNYNKYGYVLNNPMLYMDPSGEFIWMAVGFVIGAYMAGVQANGGWNPTKWNWGQTWGKIVMGGAIGAVSGGMGAAAGTAAMAASGFTGGVIGGAIAGSVGGLVGGAISGLGNSVIFGGNPITGTLTGALSGAVMGGVIGGVAGGVGTLWSNSRATDPSQLRNIWSNESVVAGRSPWAFNNIEKPTVTVGKIKTVIPGEVTPEGIDGTGTGTLKLQDLGDGVKIAPRPNEIVNSVKEFEYVKNFDKKIILNGDLDISDVDYKALYNSYSQSGKAIQGKNMSIKGYSFKYFDSYKGSIYPSTSLGGTPSMHIINNTTGWQYKIRFNIK